MLIFTKSSSATFPYIRLVAYTDKAVDLMKLDIESESEITAEKVREVMKSVRSAYTPKVACESIAGRFESCSQGHELRYYLELSPFPTTRKWNILHKDEIY